MKSSSWFTTFYIVLIFISVQTANCRLIEIHGDLKKIDEDIKNCNIKEIKIENMEKH